MIPSKEKPVVPRAGLRHEPGRVYRQDTRAIQLCWEVRPLGPGMFPGTGTIEALWRDVRALQELAKKSMNPKVHASVCCLLNYLKWLG